MAFTPLRFVDNDKNKALFYATLRKRVDSYFKENNISRNYNAQMVIKTIVLLASYIVPFVLLLTLNPSFGIAIILWSIMGLGLAGIGMGIMHDANHEAYSKNKSVNFWLGQTIYLIGGARHNWKVQHNVLHHTYTNVADYDEDIDEKLILKFTPHDTSKWYHRFQPIYAILFYGITVIYWCSVKDFLQYFRYNRKGLNNVSPGENRMILFKIVLSKIIFFSVFLVMPTVLFHIPFLEVLTGFLIMSFISGVVLTVIFQLAHTVEGTSHPLPNEAHTIENNWAVHQLSTTVNFSRHNKILSWYLGGLNFQVEHHLFPNICHVHYPQISEIVKSTAEEFGIPYLENKSFGTALASHIRALKHFGSIPSLDEAIG